MSLTKFTGNTNVISQLADVPVQTGDTLKAKFDEAETAIKNYLNNTLTTEVDQLVATEKASLQNLISSLSTSTTNSINELNTNKNTMISDGYSNTKVYKIGDLCIYNDTLYRCTTAIDEGEAWNSSHWEQTNLGDEVRKPEVYSTDEVDTGEIWIDGKKIYRKVIEKTTTSNETIYDISDIPFDYLKMDGRVILNPGQGEEYRVEPYRQNDSDFVRSPFLKTSEKKIALNSHLAGGNVTRKWIVVLEYTKTTD